jgi:hypothetical protein
MRSTSDFEAAMRVLFIRTISYRQEDTLAVDPVFLFTAQTLAAAARKAGACGWAVND